MKEVERAWERFKRENGETRLTMTDKEVFEAGQKNKDEAVKEARKAERERILKSLSKDRLKKIMEIEFTLIKNNVELFSYIERVQKIFYKELEGGEDE